MPRYVVSKLEAALDQRFARSLGSARILILGLAYKKNVADIRESPSLKLIELIERRGARVDFHDPHVAAIPLTRAHAEIEGRRSVDLTPDVLEAYDAVLVVTDHDAVDYALVAAHARLLIDTRNVFHRKGIVADHIVKS
jgi:UDP-N-acetyl-D-glucosamine dehydrogenase